MNLMADGGSAVCVVEDHVVHIYDPSALQSKANALNYIFPAFSVPESADLFVISFRIHLSTEAFRPKEMGPVSGSDGGATPNDADNYKLTPERVTNMEARKLLLREAAAVPMVFVVEVHTCPMANRQEAWDKSNKTLQFAVMR